jgi:hypothetical protein
MNPETSKTQSIHLHLIATAAQMEEKEWNKKSLDQEQYRDA